ncbi:MAG: RNA polymerase sigma factor [Pseudobacter sp.]|uniref:RNA polymerase sigma factor n=1 Tax=Pseudobacter sp. TaxID=2045420 RepID=UPI003F7D9F02
MPEIKLYNEKQLLLQIAAGDAAAYANIFDFYSKHVYVLSLKFTKDPAMAEDLTQEIFTRLWVNRQKLAEVHNFKAFLNTVSRNLLRNYLRKKVLSPENETYLAGYFRESSANAQDRLEFKELEAALNQAIGTLPEQLKKVFTLSRVEGLSHEEIANRLGISRISVKSYIFRALLIIREHLGRRHPFLLHVLLVFLGSK